MTRNFTAISLQKGEYAGFFFEDTDEKDDFVLKMLELCRQLSPSEEELTAFRENAMKALQQE